MREENLTHLSDIPRGSPIQFSIMSMEQSVNPSVLFVCLVVFYLPCHSG